MVMRTTPVVRGATENCAILGQTIPLPAPQGD